MKRILPSYPLFVKDPNFSLWTPFDVLNEGDVEAWFGEKKSVYGFVRVDGVTYRILGNGKRFLPFGVKMAKQTDLRVRAFSTDYTFALDECKLSLSFVSPVPPSDLELLGLPVCYLEYRIEGAEGKEVELSLFLGADVAYNKNDDEINRSTVGGVLPLRSCESAFLGLHRQHPLSNTNDLIGADWGYWHVAGEVAYLADAHEMFAYLSTGTHDFCAKEADRYAVAFSKGAEGTVLIGCDDTIAIEYYGDYRKGYMLENYTMAECIDMAVENKATYYATLETFEQKLISDTKGMPESYLPILFASLRQSVTGHKLVRDKCGNVLFLSKENGSNGCIATVDVSYPSIPLYLYANVELVKGMMRPILDFARMPIWKYDFAPHDAGTYPVCSGQVYGLLGAPEDKYIGNFRTNIWHDGKPCKATTHLPYYAFPSTLDIYDYSRQMPVEECANMLVMFLGVSECEGNVDFFRANLDLAEKWVEYLVKFGLYPEEQLCTDDFAGHLKNNINLAIKATVGIGAYARMLGKTGNAEGEKKYRAIAEQFAKTIEDFANNYSHLPLTWDSDDSTFSLKYNMAFDKIYHLGLFSKELMEREIDTYIEKCNEYGTPLDTRAIYTKSDWIVWSAVLTDDNAKREKLLSPIVRFLEESPRRIPFSDWYDTDSGTYHYFRARTVQGGTFILLL